MDIIERNVQILVSSIRQSSVYKEYKKQEEILGKQPQLKARVDHFRAGNYQAQKETRLWSMQPRGGTGWSMWRRRG